MNLKDMIATIVREQVSEVVSEMLIDLKVESANSVPRRAQKDIETVAASRKVGKVERETKPTTDRRNGPRIGYVPLKARIDVDSLPQSYAKAYAAIARGKGKVVTAPEIERISGLGKKTVESAVWHLRTMKAIKSVPVER